MSDSLSLEHTAFTESTLDLQYDSAVCSPLRTSGTLCYTPEIRNSSQRTKYTSVYLNIPTQMDFFLPVEGFTALPDHPHMQHRKLLVQQKH